MRCWPRWWCRCARELAATRAELAQARERIAELEAPAEADAAELLQAAVSEGLAKPPPAAVAAEEERPQAGRAGRA